MIDPTLQTDLDVLIEVAREAGALALRMAESGDVTAWDKAPGDPVTAADLAVDRKLRDRLMAHRPDYAWLSEETEDTDAARHSAQRIWVVDPIDGTRAYMRGGPDWCIGLAIVEAGAAVAGVIFAPREDKLYAAIRGGGATLNGTRIAASCRGELEGSRVIAAEGLVKHPDWHTPWPDLQLAMPSPNATLLRLAAVADGSQDATMTLARKSDWDLAAGTLMLEEAGGVATAHTGAAFVYNRAIPAQMSLIAAGKPLHPLLIERTQRVRLADPNETPPHN